MKNDIPEIPAEDVEKEQNLFVVLTKYESINAIHGMCFPEKQTALAFLAKIAVTDDIKTRIVKIKIRTDSF